MCLDSELTAEEEVKQFSEAAQHLLQKVRGPGSAHKCTIDRYLSNQAQSKEGAPAGAEEAAAGGGHEGRER